MPDQGDGGRRFGRLAGQRARGYGKLGRLPGKATSGHLPAYGPDGEPLNRAARRRDKRGKGPTA